MAGVVPLRRHRDRGWRLATVMEPRLAVTAAATPVDAAADSARSLPAAAVPAGHLGRLGADRLLRTLLHSDVAPRRVRIRRDWPHAARQLWVGVRRPSARGARAGSERAVRTSHLLVVRHDDDRRFWRHHPDHVGGDAVHVGRDVSGRVHGVRRHRPADGGARARRRLPGQLAEARRARRRLHQEALDAGAAGTPRAGVPAVPVGLSARRRRVDLLRGAAAGAARRGARLPQRHDAAPHPALRRRRRRADLLAGVAALPGALPAGRGDDRRGRDAAKRQRAQLDARVQSDARRAGLPQRLPARARQGARVHAAEPAGPGRLGPCAPPQHQRAGRSGARAPSQRH